MSRSGPRELRGALSNDKAGGRSRVRPDRRPPRAWRQPPDDRQLTRPGRRHHTTSAPLACAVTLVSRSRTTGRARLGRVTGRGHRRRPGTRANWQRLSPGRLAGQWGRCCGRHGDEKAPCVTHGRLVRERQNGERAGHFRGEVIQGGGPCGSAVRERCVRRRRKGRKVYMAPLELARKKERVCRPTRP